MKMVKADQEALRKLVQFAEDAPGEVLLCLFLGIESVDQNAYIWDYNPLVLETANQIAHELQAVWSRRGMSTDDFRNKP
jgi:hypothetical protein